MIPSLGTNAVVFLVMVFVSVLLLAWSVIVPTVSSEAQASRRMKKRIGGVLESIDPGSSSLLREQNQKNMSSFERALEKIPLVSDLSTTLQQGGYTTRATAFIVRTLLLAMGLGFVVTIVKGNILFGLLAACLAIPIPYILALRKRAKRIARFEEQIPEALDLISRALEAGHPFHETLKMVSEEMMDPIASEFNQVYNDISYGVSQKMAFLSMLSRVPSVSLNATVTAVLIQSESGGRLSEILRKIASVIRSRFKLQRKVKTLSAEGRMSAWVLSLMPFVLALVISITTPSYLPKMIDDPLGIKLVFVAFAFVLIGILWIRKIIRFRY